MIAADDHRALRFAVTEAAMDLADMCEQFDCRRRSRRSPDPRHANASRVWREHQTRALQAASRIAHSSSATFSRRFSS